MKRLHAYVLTCLLISVSGCCSRYPTPIKPTACLTRPPPKAPSIPVVEDCWYHLCLTEESAELLVTYIEELKAWQEFAEAKCKKSY